MNTLIRLSVFAALVLGMASCSFGRKKTWTYEPSANGKTAIIVKGKAVPPANIPHAVLRAVSAGNRICGKPYLMGGGHRRFEDKAYDCSGAVSYLLHHAGCLSAPTTSSALRKFGEKGEGRWITVYAKNGHLHFSCGPSDGHRLPWRAGGAALDDSFASGKGVCGQAS